MQQYQMTSFIENEERQKKLAKIFANATMMYFDRDQSRTFCETEIDANLKPIIQINSDIIDGIPVKPKQRTSTKHKQFSALDMMSRIIGTNIPQRIIEISTKHAKTFTIDMYNTKICNTLKSYCQAIVLELLLVSFACLIFKNNIKEIFFAYNLLETVLTINRINKIITVISKYIPRITKMRKLKQLIYGLIVITVSSWFLDIVQISLLIIIYAYMWYLFFSKELFILMKVNEKMFNKTTTKYVLMYSVLYCFTFVYPHLVEYLFN